MLTKVITQEEWYSVEMANANKNTLYVFGDNSIYKGQAGQATIRYCSNSIGIPTKKFPAVHEDAYFCDDEEDRKEMSEAIERLFQEAQNYEILVFPKDGLGTGLSKMPEKSPILFQELCDWIEQNYSLRMTNKGFEYD